jgi:hypothetical protein
MLIITNWNGRTGNNILQIIRAVHYAILNNHIQIRFPKHSLLKEDTILIEGNSKNNDIIKDTFFNLKKHELNDPEPYIMREYYQRYLAPIDAINNMYTGIDNDTNELYIHIRSGDIFSKSPHSCYVQPPLYYYKNIMNKYNNINIVFEDNVNPCVNMILSEKNVINKSGSFIHDLITLSNAENLVIGFGTFGLMIYFMNKNIKNLYIPKYFLDESNISGNWGENINVNIVELLDYIPVGSWKNTPEQR